jgi:hypothetical protein
MLARLCACPDPSFTAPCDHSSNARNDRHSMQIASPLLQVIGHNLQLVSIDTIEGNITKLNLGLL